MDRGFRLTLFGSVLGHLIVGSVFTIVVFPTKWAAQPPAAPIRFLGPILLEDVYQKQAQSKEKLLMTSEQALDARALKHFELDPEPAGKEVYQTQGPASAPADDKEGLRDLMTEGPAPER